MFHTCHGEERRDEAIFVHGVHGGMASLLASLAMTGQGF
jgi:hypothetical protein